MGTAIKHTVPDRVKPSFVIFDIRALWRSERQSARMSKITNDLVMLVVDLVVGFKGLIDNVLSCRMRVWYCDWAERYWSLPRDTLWIMIPTGTELNSRFVYEVWSSLQWGLLFAGSVEGWLVGVVTVGGLMIVGGLLALCVVQLYFPHSFL